MGMCVLGEWAACRIATIDDSVATYPLLLEMAAEHWHTEWGNWKVSPGGGECEQHQAPLEGRVHDQCLYVPLHCRGISASHVHGLLEVLGLQAT